MYIYSGNNIRKHIHPLPGASSSSSPPSSSSSSDWLRLALTSVNSFKNILPCQRAILSAAQPLRGKLVSPSTPIENTSNQWQNMLKPPPSSERQDSFPPHQTLPTTYLSQKKPPIICGPTKKETRFVQPVPFPTGLIRYLLQQPMRSVRCFCFCFPVGPFFPRKPRNAAKDKGK